MDLSRARWRKSSRSGGGNQCVELALLPAGAAVRDSKNPTGPALVVGRTAYETFLDAVRAGRLG
ncbi:DUF397 domain-containing protein [Gandjariella thermophila]|uniref:DUF397 domain-containing protein n=1 Tax=Gandjariella thermophila TaxID=1931992 RepID=A0A4D4JA75_9PSEU|nr:DUF397 domain-containing protein [Gandjariella thermophila]GDY31578.1 DUF397 domain-containing protein [Gandjariella thermophila]